LFPLIPAFSLREKENFGNRKKFKSVWLNSALGLDGLADGFKTVAIGQLKWKLMAS